VDRPEIRIVGMGVALREWTAGDLRAMVEIFDDPEVAYRTPVASPFDLDAAGAYLQKISRPAPTEPGRTWPSPSRAASHAGRCC
jgi:hypothetical protein